MISNNFEQLTITTTTNNNNGANKVNSNSNPTSPSTSPRLLSSSFKILLRNKKKHNKNNSSNSNNNQQQQLYDNDEDEDITFNNLPIEIIEKIYCYLFVIDICRLSSVCSFWNTLSKSNKIWEHMYIKRSFHCQLLKQNPHDIDFKSVLKLQKTTASNWRNGRYKTTTLTGHTESISSLLFTGNRILSSSRDQTLKVWDYYSNECIKTFNNKSIINVMEKDLDNQRVACGTLNGFINVYNLETMELEHTEKGHNGFVMTMKSNLNSNIYCTGSKDKQVKLWNFCSVEDGYSSSSDEDDVVLKLEESNKTSLMIRSLGCHSTTVSNIEWCNMNNNHLYTSGGNIIKQWDIETGQLLNEFSNQSTRIINPTCLSVKDGLISAGGEGVISIWDSRDTTTPIKEFTSASQIYSLQCEPSLNSFVTASADKIVRCYRIFDQLTCEQEFIGHTQPVSYVHYNPAHILSAGLDGSVFIWNFDSNFKQQQQSPLQLQQPTVNNNTSTTTTSTNNNSNNSSNNNNNGKRVGSFHKLEGNSYIRQTYSDESKIISGYHDNVIKIWDFANPKNEKKDNKCNLM